jgi:hypothetical protein
MFPPQMGRNQNPEDYGQEIVQVSLLASAFYPLFTGSLVQVLSTSAKKMRWGSSMLEPNVLLPKKRHMFQEYW